MEQAQIYDGLIDSLKFLVKNNTDMNFRYFIQPSVKLQSDEIPIYPDPLHIKFNIQQGKLDVETVVSGGPNMKNLFK